MPKSRVVMNLLLIAALIVVSGGKPVESSVGDPVMIITYNLYVGSSATPALEATNLFHLPVIVGELYKNVVTSNFAARAEDIVRIIKRSRPHIIGLQEAILLRRQKVSDFLYNRTPNADETDLDYLQIFTTALQNADLDYRVVAKSQNIDIEIPMMSAGNVTDVRLTDFDVILARGDVITSKPSSVNYSSRLTIQPLGIEVLRGYVAIDATINHITYRIVNTHLEAVSPSIRASQAKELADALANTDLPIILLGDFNTRAPEGTTYQLLLQAGFVDLWQSNSDKISATCCQSDDLKNELSQLSDRIDHIFVKSLDQQWVESIRTLTVGNQPEDRLSSGLWPSDHAGVLAYFHVE